MKVQELKKALELFDDNLDIVVLKDSKGQRCGIIGSEITIGTFEESTGDFIGLDCYEDNDPPEPDAIRLDS